ncbi:hypothetical protein Nepgr_024680 [Nepenthes gracilis]|uniref:Uncharacterized protein n=1 Tax=Nepenthes gracilis TaxID=150966 RepID=A0AAD3T501_NEPGR|nr:hypothetical protein Nepgr_024680 [Nepenthes gracilis]
MMFYALPRSASVEASLVTRKVSSRHNPPGDFVKLASFPTGGMNAHMRFAPSLEENIWHKCFQWTPSADNSFCQAVFSPDRNTELHPEFAPQNEWCWSCASIGSL